MKLWRKRKKSGAWSIQLHREREDGLYTSSGEKSFQTGKRRKGTWKDKPWLTMSDVIDEEGYEKIKRRTDHQLDWAKFVHERECLRPAAKQNTWRRQYTDSPCHINYYNYMTFFIICCQHWSNKLCMYVSIKTRGQSNLTKSASRGVHSPVRGHPRGSKVVPLNSWGRVSY